MENRSSAVPGGVAGRIRIAQQKAIDHKQQADGYDGGQILHGACLFDDHVPCDNKHQYFKQRFFAWFAQELEKLYADNNAENNIEKLKECSVLRSVFPEVQKWLP